MKTFYEDWPETFVSRLDMLRALDDNKVRQNEISS